MAGPRGIKKTYMVGQTGGARKQQGGGWALGKGDTSSADTAGSAVPEKSASVGWSVVDWPGRHSGGRCGWGGVVVSKEEAYTQDAEGSKCYVPKPSRSVKWYGLPEIMKKGGWS